MENQSRIKEICPTTTQSWIQAGALLVDVRESIEVSKLDFDVPRILHIPLSELEDRYKEIPIDMKVVVVDRNGVSSLMATNFLLNHGFTNVVNMEKGLVRWANKGFPVHGDVSDYLSSDKSFDCCSVK